MRSRELGPLMNTREPETAHNLVFVGRRITRFDAPQYQALSGSSSPGRLGKR